MTLIIRVFSGQKKKKRLISEQFTQVPQRKKNRNPHTESHDEPLTVRGQNRTKPRLRQCACVREINARSLYHANSSVLLFVTRNQKEWGKKKTQSVSYIR